MNTAASPRRRRSRTALGEAIIEIIASGLERAVRERTSATDGDISYAEESALDGPELSAVSTGA